MHTRHTTLDRKAAGLSRTGESYNGFMYLLTLAAAPECELRWPLNVLMSS